MRLVLVGPDNNAYASFPDLERRGNDLVYNRWVLARLLPSDLKQLHDGGRVSVRQLLYFSHDALIRRLPTNTVMVLQDR